MEKLKASFEAIRKACEQFQVKELYVFGSVLTESFKDDSDLDFLVVIGNSFPKGAFEQYFGLKELLEKTCGRAVDLVSYDAIRNPFFMEEIEKTKKVLYVA